jgi:hypothetical protein
VSLANLVRLHNHTVSGRGRLRRKALIGREVNGRVDVSVCCCLIFSMRSMP